MDTFKVIVTQTTKKLIHIWNSIFEFCEIENNKTIMIKRKSE